MRRRLFLAIGGDGFPRDKGRPGFEATVQVLNAMGLINYHEFHWRICGADVKEKGVEVWEYLKHLCTEVAAIEGAGGVDIDGTFYEVRFRFKADMALLLYAGEGCKVLAPRQPQPAPRDTNANSLFRCTPCLLLRHDGRCELNREWPALSYFFARLLHGRCCPVAHGWDTED